MPGSTAAAPRVDERDSELLKVTGVACSESCFSRRGNTGDLGVADLQRSIGALSLGRDARGSEGGRRVEGLNSALQLVGEELTEGSFKLLSATAGLEQLQGGSHLEHGDRGRPDRFCRLIVEPAHYGRLGIPPHQRRDDVGVKQDHDSNRAVRSGCPRSSTMSSWKAELRQT